MRLYLLFFIILWHSISLAQSKTALDSAFNQGIDLYNQGNYQKAALQFEKCVRLSKQQKKIQLVGKAYNNLGNVHSQLGKSEKALRYYLLSMEIFKKLHDTLTLAKTAKNIGALYSEQKDFKTAMQYYDEALSFAKLKKDDVLVADCLNNKGVIYEQQLQYVEALQVYNQSLAIYRLQHDTERIAMALNNSAIVQKYLKNYPESIKNYAASLAIAEKLNDQFMIAVTQNNLGNIYQMMGNYKQALALCLQANTNAKAIKAQEIIVESYDGIALAYEKLQKFDLAIKYRKAYETAKENYINTNRSSQLIEMQTKYETKKKEDEIVVLHQKSKIKNLVLAEQQMEIKRRNELLIANVFLLIGLLTLAYFWRSRQKLREQFNTEKIIRDTEELERIRMAKDIHDDLGSGLSKINFLSELIFQKAAHLPEIKNNSEAVKETASKMIENMRDLIWALNPDNTTLANLVSRMREYTTDYLEDYPITIRYEIPEFLPQTAITKESHRELFMVVKETLNNIAKYSQATDVVFAVTLTASDLMLCIQDNGIGFDAALTSKGNGLRNMKNRLEVLGGICSILSEDQKGTTITVQISLHKINKNQFKNFI